MTFHLEDLEQETVDDTFTRYKWEWLGESQSIIIQNNLEPEEIKGIIFLIMLETAIEYWHVEYTGHKTLKEFAGFTDAEFSEYINTNGEEIGEKTDARIERIKDGLKTA